MSEVKIYHAKFGHYGMENNKVMTVLVIWGERENRVNDKKYQVGGIKINYA